jgi:hypothetical protein
MLPYNPYQQPPFWPPYMPPELKDYCRCHSMNYCAWQTTCWICGKQIRRPEPPKHSDIYPRFDHYQAPAANSSPGMYLGA